MNTDTINRERLMHLYADDVLRGKQPASVFLFCERHQISEQDFYLFYGSIRQLEKSYLPHFMEKTLDMIAEQQTPYADTAREKLLTFYFAFFEQLTLNRSLILYLLQEDKGNATRWDKVERCRPLFTSFVKGLALNQMLERDELKVLKWFSKVQHRTTADIFWVHFLSVLKFWIDDDSARFEKTDIYIEKSLDTAFTLLDSTPVRKVADLGKFIYKEKIHPFL